MQCFDAPSASSAGAFRLAYSEERRAGTNDIATKWCKLRMCISAGFLFRRLVDLLLRNERMNEWGLIMETWRSEVMMMIIGMLIMCRGGIGECKWG